MKLLFISMILFSLSFSAWSHCGSCGVGGNTHNHDSEHDQISTDDSGSGSDSEETSETENEADN